MAKIKIQRYDEFLVKSNKLVEARYHLSLQESQVVLWLLTQIRPEDEGFKVHTLKVSEFSKMVGVDPGNRYKELRKITMRLLQRGLSIEEPDQNKILQVTWLNSAEYNTNHGTVDLEISSKLKPYLLKLKGQFTKIQLSDAMGFKSVYSIRIFELLVQYAAIGKRSMTIEELRAWCGIEAKEYALYSNLKKDVLERAKKEINAKTEYEVDYTEIKESRKVVAIAWTIKKVQTSLTARAQVVEGEKPIDYDSCAFPQLVDFCQRNKSGFPRPLSDYILGAITFELTETKLTIGVSDPWHHKCLEETPGSDDRIKEYFQIKEVQFVSV